MRRKIGLLLAGLVAVGIFAAQRKKVDPKEWPLFLPEAEGKAETVIYCGHCHDLGFVQKSRKPPERWLSTVQAMYSRGATGPSPEEMETIAGYLSAHFSPQTPELPIPLSINVASVLEISVFFCIPPDVSEKIAAQRAELKGFPDFETFANHCGGLITGIERYTKFLVFKTH